VPFICSVPFFCSRSWHRARQRSDSTRVKSASSSFYPRG
jgi:hypothetical protein